MDSGVFRIHIADGGSWVIAKAMGTNFATLSEGKHMCIDRLMMLLHSLYLRGKYMYKCAQCGGSKELCTWYVCGIQRYLSGLCDSMKPDSGAKGVKYRPCD